MRRPFFSTVRDERGAILIQVAVAMVGLLSFTALVADYGVMWTSRRQAQNAADAAALAGAISLAFDDPVDFGRARISAAKTGIQTSVFGIAPNIDPAADISFPACPPGTPGLADTCVRANVYRNDVKDPLPTFFARLFGRTEQGVQATATAQILTGNATDCMKPWAVMDKWEEHVKCDNYNGNGCQSGWINNYPNAWTTDDDFDKYQLSGQGGLDPTIPSPTPGPDVYVPPTTDDPGTGFQPFLSDGVTPGPDYGRLLQLKLGGGDPQLSSGWFKALDLDCSENPDCPGDSGSNQYGFNINHCVAKVYKIGDTIPVETGNMTGMTGKGTYDGTNGQNASMGIAQLDPDATWNNTTKTIENSCAPGVCADGKWYAQSPRIVPVPLVNVDAYLGANPNGNGGSVTIVNLFGFFIITPDQAAAAGFNVGNGNANDVVYGAMVTIPGLTEGPSTVPITSAFLRQVVLVR
jgi:hypothetical protein